MNENYLNKKENMKMCGEKTKHRVLTTQLIESQQSFILFL